MSSEPDRSGADAPLARSLTVIMPVYNDWQSAALLIHDIGIAMAGSG